MSPALSLLVAVVSVVEPVQVQVGAAFASDSIDRGTSDFEGRPALAPQVVLSAPELVPFAAIEAGAAMNLALLRRSETLSDGETRCSDLDELSLWMSLSRPLGPLSLSAGVITYQLVSAEAWPRDGASRLELATSVELPELLAVVPRLDLFWDPADTGDDGVYGKLSLSVNPVAPLSLTAHAGATTQTTQPEPGFADLGLTASWELTEGGVGFVPCAGVMWAPNAGPGAPHWLAYAGTEIRFASGD